MKVKAFGVETEEGAFLLTGPSGSGKTKLLRTLYATYGLLTNSPLAHVAITIFTEEIKKRANEKPCKRDECVECEFELKIEDLEAALEETLKVILKALRLEKLEAEVNGAPLKFDVKKLCKNETIKTGERSFVSFECDGKVLKGRWRWCLDEEIPYPYDRLSSELFGKEMGLAIYLPPGRGYLGTKEECKEILEMQVCKGLKGSELEVEKKLLEWALSEGTYVFIEGIYADEEYLRVLKELLERRKAKLVIIESRDEKVAKELGLEVIKLGEGRAEGQGNA